MFKCASGVLVAAVLFVSGSELVARKGITFGLHKPSQYRNRHIAIKTEEVKIDSNHYRTDDPFVCMKVCGDRGMRAAALTAKDTCKCVVK